jgi:hypothetical protein
MTLGSLAVSCCVSASGPMKAGATEADFLADARECRALVLETAPRQFDARTQHWGPDAYIVSRDQRLCMEARGWYFPPGFVMP